MKENSRNQEYKVTNAAHGSVVIGIKPVTKRRPVRAQLWSTGVVCCVCRQLADTLCTQSQSTQLQLGTGLRDGLHCDGLVFHPSQSLSSSKHYKNQG